MGNAAVRRLQKDGSGHVCRLKVLKIVPECVIPRGRLSRQHRIGLEALYSRKTSAFVSKRLKTQENVTFPQNKSWRRPDAPPSTKDCVVAFNKGVIIITNNKKRMEF